MPLSESENLRRPAPRYRERIIGFLADTPGVAYSVPEIMAALGYTQEKSLQTRMLDLYKKGILERHSAMDEEVGRRRYYYSYPDDEDK